MQKPVVSWWKTYVGKSSIFNRLVGQRMAIVTMFPVLPRPPCGRRRQGWDDFFVVDTVVSTKQTASQNVLSIGSADFIQEIRDQAEIALEEADVILLVTDALDGVTQADREVVDILRKRRKANERETPPILLVVNKADSPNARMNSLDFYSLGLGEPYPISAIHGTGTGDLLDAVIEHFPTPNEDEEEDESIKVAIVWEPNAGKSSLLNKITGNNVRLSVISPVLPATRSIPK